MTEFLLHARLEADTAFVLDWPLSRVLLMNDGRYPWLVLVPRRAKIRELHDLIVEDRTRLIEEAAAASAALASLTAAAKINIGALGNLVPQFHLHVVARQLGDAAWPGPVWGQGPAEAYAADARAILLGRLRLALRDRLA